MTPTLRKTVIGVLGLGLLVFSGLSFRRSRSLKEPVVIGPGVTRVVRLGDYFEGVRGSTNDAHIYVLEGSEPGGTILVLGGTHPEEPAGRLAAWIMAEQAVVRAGRVFVVLSANRSAATATRLGGAYPPGFAIQTPWGEQAFRTGDRWSNPLDQWPDPEVYIHYPSRQELAYVDIRNLNRTWPGRPDGTLTERTCHAFIELIRREKVDILIDLHEAELQYPVISAIVAHQKGQDLAAMASMMISAEDGFAMGVEYSPLALHGLSHREVGDHTDAISLLLEAPEPFLDATRGRTDADLLLTGRDPFVVRAGRHGLLFEKIDEKGWPIDVRVGRHTSAILRILEVWSGDAPDRAVVIEGLPGYDEVIAKGVGAYLRDPSAADPKSVYFE
ncbi:MAG: succinylglutamate desuccinylase/aspartoacylase family protein [Candidatus Aminicenantes bacterium]|nr:succinylglutamate desuccinylase/aspartoacylase family protein [Candidatus Aminicenantes bacterium]